jgi:hypothetical protein
MRPPDVTSLRFLRDLTSWSLAAAAAVALAGGMLTRDWRFVVSCALGAAFDIGSLELLLRRTSLRTAEDTVESSRVAAVVVAERLVVKALLLAAAVAFSDHLSLWGMLAGVLVFDATLMVVGSAKAASAMWRLT